MSTRHWDNHPNYPTRDRVDARSQTATLDDDGWMGHTPVTPRLLPESPARMLRLSDFKEDPRRTLKVYVSGPMEGYENFNFPAFQAASDWLTRQGYEVLNPADPQDIDPTNPNLATNTRENFLRRDIEMVLEADFVVVLEGWQVSRGARLEVSVARAIGVGVNRIEDNTLMKVEDETTLEEALRIAGGGDRQRQYGHPVYNFARTAQIMSAILGVDVTAEQAALCMIGVKLARESFKQHRDNLVDIAGYTLVYEQILEGRKTLARGGVLPNVKQNGESEYPTS